MAAPRAVRLSLTDRCDLACVYCRPDRRDGYTQGRLDVGSWQTVVAGLMASGVRRVRLTGGEPLLYRDVVEVVRMLARLPLDDLALTTNATRLAALAMPLREAGLRRLNISIDSLDEARFARMTRGGRLGDVLSGIEAAIAAGFDEIKLNTVVVGGENDVELASIAAWAWAKGLVPRFLEVMAIGEGAALRDRVVTGKQMRAVLAPLLCDDEPRGESDRGPARYVVARHDSRLRVGFITGGKRDLLCGMRSRSRDERRRHPALPRDRPRGTRRRGAGARGRCSWRGLGRGRGVAPKARCELARLHRGDGRCSFDTRYWWLMGPMQAHRRASARVAQST